ncbi:MAG TPA: 3-hydroxyacyl-CoA dehydrogenase family protein [Kofleriaceae bacterium]
MSATKSIRKVVVLGANGTMGAGSGAVFACAGLPTVFLARTLAKAEAGRKRAVELAKGRLAPDAIEIGTYDDHIAHVAREADLIFEAVSEDVDTKRRVFALVERVRAPGSIVATVSSGLSIAALCAEHGEDFRRNFLGIHLFNPPTAIVGCELIAHADTAPEVVQAVRELLEHALDRVVVECADTPAFAGNRVGFKVLNEVAQLAEEHGVAYMDQLVGSHTGRALAPLATIDLVGWDVHGAIVDHLWDKTRDEAHASFLLPAYMRHGIERGHLGRKTRDKGGFFRVDGRGESAVHHVLDPKTGGYRLLAETRPAVPAFVERMKAAIRSGRHPDALDALCRATGKDAELLRGVLLGYISYALGRVGEVVAHGSDIDRIMGFGFNWAPPGMLVDAIGPARTAYMLEQAGLPVPPVVSHAASTGMALFIEPVEPSRFFIAA